MPFGLCNASGTFQRLMDLTLSDLNFQILLVYLDDIIVYSRTLTEHLKRLDQLFQKLVQANLKLKPSKCFLLQTRVGFLGHVISEQGITTEEGKSETVRGWPVPHMIKETRGFLRFCSYYRKFVKDFSIITAPLHN